MSLSVMVGRQLSFFGAETVDPSPADLAGLLAGPGQVVRMGGTARVSVVVDAAWRVHVLTAELAARGLTASWVHTADAHLGVRTSYARSLAPLGISWLRGAVKRPPADFYLDGPRMRLWVAAAGTASPLGFLLRLGPSDEECWAVVGAALEAIGLSAVLVGRRVTRPALAARTADCPPDESQEPSEPHDSIETDESDGASVPIESLAPVEEETARSAEELADRPSTEPGPLGSMPISGPAYRITGRRRLVRLAELVGERPPAAPIDVWPG